MTKATTRINELVEEINDNGLSVEDGISLPHSFLIHHNNIDVVPSRPTKMDLKETMRINNLLRGPVRVATMEGRAPVISRSLLKRGNRTLDIYVTCGTTTCPGELSEIMAENKVTLDKYCRDLGFTPGWHSYNILDAWIPWDSVRTIDLDRGDEGWI